MPTSPATFTAAPALPDRANRATFAALAQDWTLWEKNTAYPYLAGIGSNVYGNAVEAAGAATAAANANLAVQALANLSNWTSGATYAINDRRLSLVNGNAYRRITNGAGTTDPANDPTNWAPFGGGSGAGVTSFNGQTGAVSYVAPVTSVNGMTGAVTITGGSSGVTSFNGLTGVVTYTAPVSSVNGRTGAVAVNWQDLALPVTVANAGTVYLLDADQEVRVPFAGQCNIILPASNTPNRTVQVQGVNGREDIAVYVEAASAYRLIVGGTDVLPGEYTLLNWKNPCVKFVLKDVWRPC